MAIFGYSTFDHLSSSLLRTSFAVMQEQMGSEIFGWGVHGTSIFIFLFVRALKKDTLVALWGVALYWWRKLSNCIFQFWPSALVAWMNLFIILMKCLDQWGVVFLWQKPISDFEKNGHYLSWQLSASLVGKIQNLDMRWPHLLMLPGLSWLYRQWPPAHSYLTWKLLRNLGLFLFIEQRVTVLGNSSPYWTEVSINSWSGIQA